MQGCNTKPNDEHALGADEEQLKQLFDVSPVAMGVSSGVDGRVEAINGRFTELFGYTLEDIPDTEHWWRLAYPDEKSRQAIKAHWMAIVEQAATKHSQIEPVEATVTCKDGSHCYVEFRLSTMGDKQLVTFVDLTRRKQIEEQLREREKHSQSLLHLSRNLEQSQTYEEALNAAREEVRKVIGYQNLWVYFLTKDRKHFKAVVAGGPVSDTVLSEDTTATLVIEGDKMLEELAKATEIVVVEDAPTDERTNKEIVASLGNRTIVNVPIILLDRMLGAVGMGTFGEEGVRVPSRSEREYLTALASHLAVAFDRIHLLAERQNAEQRIKQLAAIVESSDDAIISKTLDGVILSWNRGAERIYGYSEAEAVGQPMSILVPPEREDELHHLLQRIKNGEHIEHFETTRRRKDGRSIFMSLTISPILDVDGTIIAASTIGRDITKQQQIENIGQARLRLLEFASSHSLDEFLTATLDELEALTGSTIGFYHFLESDQKTLLFQNWSTNTLQNMCTADGKGSHYGVDQAGVWVDCVHQRRAVIHNDYASLPYHKGMPAGHTPIIREAIVPIFRGGSIKTIIGIGNKATDYNDADIQIISQVGDFSWDITERKWAEEALRESERRLVAAQHMAHVGYWERDFDTNRVALSDEACRIFGISEQGLSLNLDQWHSRWVALIHPEDQPRLIELLGDVLAGIRSYDVEYRVIRPDGTVRFICSQAEVKRDASGHPRNMLGMMQDITDRKQAEQALRASENRFRVLSENAFVGIYIIQDGRLSYVNSTLAKIFGYTPEELTGADPALVIQPDDQAMVLENIRRRISGEVETVHYEFRGRCKDGRTKDIEVLGGRINFGGKTAVIGNLMDITDRKRAAGEIARSLAAEKKARQVAEILRDANASLSRTLNLDDVLQNLLQYLMQLVPYDSANVMLREGDFRLRVVALRGYEQWADVDAAQHLVFDIRDIPSLDALVTTQKSILIANTYEYPGWARVPGTEHVISWLGVPVIADGQVIGLYSVDKTEPGFFTDEHRFLAEGLAAQAAIAIQNTRLHDQITRSNAELEQRVASRTAQLETVNKELEAFAYSVSHDLRAPLRHIDGFIDLLQRKTRTPLDEQSQHYMKVIADSAKEMGKLIDDLLSFSRMGRNEMFHAEVDLNELVLEVIEQCKREAQGREIEWKISPLMSIIGDRAMLRIVLVNLISNAVKFTRPREIAQIEIGYERKNNAEVVFFVRDNGVGFDMAYVDKLFGVFQRLHQAEEFEGTGIGLANVRRIINRHGGTVWAEGETDHGATFYFSLPNKVLERRS